MNVLITSTTFIPSVLLCGHCQMDYLEKQGKLNYRFVIAHFINERDVDWADTIIFLRSDDDINAYVSKIAKKLGKHTIYVLDDDILNVPKYLSSAPYYLLPSTQKNIKTIMQNCDSFLTPSPVLLNKYGDWFKHKFNIVEPSLNRINKREKNDKIKIGFAGSIDRAQDINIILKDTITKLVKNYGDKISIEFMGAKPDFVDELGLTHLPYQDGYEAYTAFMAKCNWDIGLAPMPESEFHRCKYFNKYVEYSSFGIVGVYSNVEPYIFGIKDEYNGLLVNNDTDSWYDAICRLIEDNKLRNRLSNNCLKEANEIYSLEVASNEYLEKVLVGYNGPVDGKCPSLRKEKFLLFFKRIFRKIRSEGKNFPKWLAQKVKDKYQTFTGKLIDKRNLKKIYKTLQTRKTVCLISPMFDNSKDVYNQEIKDYDKQIGDDVYKIYISGEDRLLEHLKIELIDENHAYIVCNSFDVNQSDALLDIISKSKNVIVHGIIRFMRERISTDMFKMFDINNVNVLLVSHGNKPEECHEASNFHTERTLNDIEKVFVEKASSIICENENVKNVYLNKYNLDNNKINVNDADFDIKELLKYE